MALEIRIPRLGWTMEEGTFLGWLKKDGDPVQVGDLLYTLEGEKAAQEIESMDAGILRIPPDAPHVGATLSVGSLIGFLTAENEPLPWTQPSYSAAPDAATAATNPQPSSVSGAMAVSGEDVEPGKNAASPRARKAASRLNVDVSQIQGTGKGKRVRERDVLMAAMEPRAQEDSPAAHPTSTFQYSSVRHAIARKMRVSWENSTPVTLMTTADATNLVNLRSQFKSIASKTNDLVPGYTEMLVKIVAAALKVHPRFNAVQQNEQLKYLEEIHVGVAVDTEVGLLVPVLKNADKLSLREVVTRVRGLVARAQSQSLTAMELQGGTFTVTNLGSFGVEHFTPIINYPEVAILGIGQICRKSCVNEDRIEPRDQVTLSLTFDHRVNDGAPAARFLQTIRDYVASPGPLLL